MKGIILAGGTGSRLYPITKVISKQLLPVYNKPMIYYPLSTLMSAGIRDILIISTPMDTPYFKRLLGDGKKFGIRLRYKVQENPNGLAESFIIGENFIDGNCCAMILGDNIFIDDTFGEVLKAEVRRIERQGGATVFAYPVFDPQRFGVVSVDQYGIPESIEEKPKNPKSNLAVTGLYFYDKNAPKFAKTLKPSYRGELEITDLNQIYLKTRKLNVVKLGNDMKWLDMGTFDSLINASELVRDIEMKKGKSLAVLEEIAIQNNWITKTMLASFAASQKNSDYGKYVASLVTDRKEPFPERPKTATVRKVK